MIPAANPTFMLSCQECGRPFGAAREETRFCSQRCANISRSLPATERFWRKVARLGPDECWVYSKASAVHAKFWNGTALVKAHRFSWELHNGPIPAGLSVCHRCDNPPCVNPAHLFLGTHAENMADRNAKGRQARGDRSPVSKLTTDDVREIKRAIANRENQTALARRFGVSHVQISHIRHGKTWAHVSI